MRYLLDTHTWLWWNARPEALSPTVRRLLSAPSAGDDLLISAVSVWELCEWLRSGRLALSVDPEAWIDKALDMPGLRLIPLTPRLSARSLAIPEPSPADSIDRVLAAVAREENATILTGDHALLDYPHARTLW